MLPGQRGLSCVEQAGGGGGQQSRGQGGTAPRGCLFTAQFFLQICSSAGHCPDFAAPKQRPSKSLSLWVSPRPVRGLRQHLASPGLGREDGFGGCCLWGRRQGGGRAGHSDSQPHPSAITLPHTPRSRASRHPRIHCHLPVPRKLLLSLCSWGWVPVWPRSLPAPFGKLCLSFPT